MKKSVKIITGILGFIMLFFGLDKFFEPFKTYIYQHLVLSGMPFPEILRYIAQYTQIGLGVLLLFLVFKGSSVNKSLKNRLFNLGNFTVIMVMLVATYVHLHPNVPAYMLPIKVPVLPGGLIILVIINLYLNKEVLNNENVVNKFE